MARPDAGELPALVLSFFGPAGSLDATAAAIADWHRTAGLPADAVQGLGPMPVPDAPDAEFAQLALNGDRDDAPACWRELTARADTLLARLDLSALWGWSCLYQGYADAHRLAEEAGVLAAQVPLPAGLVPAHPPLAQDLRPGGVLSLLALPSQTGPSASLAVVARGAAQAPFGTAWFFGPAAQALLPELIVHKGSQQIRQYRSHRLVQAYEARVDRLGTTARQLLLGVPGVPALPLLSLAEREVHEILVVLQEFELLGISLQQQADNLAAHQAGEAGGAVLRFQLERIRMGMRELEHLVAKGRTVREACLVSIEAQRARLEAASLRRQTLLQNAVAVAGAALAVPQLVDRGLLKTSLLRLDAKRFPDATADLIAFGVQLGLVVVLALLASLLLQRLGRDPQ